MLFDSRVGDRLAERKVCFTQSYVSFDSLRMSSKGDDKSELS